ncbi:MAG: hypothetical protein ACR2MS_12655 [Weeksellaceae bacterium]
MNTQVISKVINSRVIWVFIFIFPIIFIWQDGDLGDTGYNLTLYQFFFDRLEDNITDSVIFLTEFIGGVFFKLMPISFGIYNIKILALVFLYANVYMSYGILKRLFPKSTILPLLLLIALIFNIRCFPLIFNYDLFSAFFLILIIYILSLKNAFTSTNFIVIGIITFLATLSRLPNILLIILLPVSTFIGVLLNIIDIEWKKFTKLITYFIGSTLVSATVLYAIMEINGIANIYSQNLFHPSEILQNESTSYNIYNVLKIYALDLMYFIIYFIATSILLYVYEKLYSSLKFNKLSKYLPLLFLLGLFMFSLYPFTFNYNNAIKYLVPSIIIISLLKSSINNRVKWVVLLTLTFVLILIAGSNTGIFLKSSLLYLILIPVAFNSLFNSVKNQFKNLTIIFATYTLIMSTFIYTVFIYGVGQGGFIRIEARHPVNADLYNGVYTTQELANQIETTTRNLLEVKSSDTTKLFIYGHQPLYYYLSGMQPADKEFWLIGNSLAKPATIFDRIKEKKEKPIILETHQALFSKETEEIKDNFLKENHYQLVKSTQFHDIWVPIESKN